MVGGPWSEMMRSPKSLPEDELPRSMVVGAIPSLSYPTVGRRKVFHGGGKRGKGAYGDN